jgi:hypothetical protein
MDFGLRLFDQIPLEQLLELSPRSPRSINR